MRSVFKLLAANLTVLIGIYIVFLVILLLVQDLMMFTKPWRKSHDIRADALAYKDHVHARLVYKQLREVTTSYKPFVAWRQMPVNLSTIKIDHDGNRLHSKGKANNKPGAKTIGLFGGSTMWGVGVDGDNTIPAHFDRMTDDYNVVNYGERGYTSRQGLALLINLINQNKAPQTVVFYDGFNDIWVHCNYSITKSLNGHITENFIKNSTNKGSQIYSRLIKPVVELIGSIAGRRSPENETACSKDPKRADAVAELLVSNWTMAHDLITKSGGKFYAFLQPHLYIGSTNSDYIKQKYKQRGTPSEFQTVYPLIIKKIKQKNLAWAFDISTAINGSTPYLVDHAHLSPDGNKLIAQQFIEHITKSK